MSRQLHRPVLLEEVMRFWRVRPGGTYLDGTLGAGGHAEALLSLDPSARCLALDRDPDAVDAASERLKKFGGRVIVVRENFSNAQAVMARFGIPALDGSLLDLGVSSMQLDRADRGFSQIRSGPLDMRMDPTRGETARDLIVRLQAGELARVIREYGEEPHAGKIARVLKEAVSAGRLKTTVQCADLVSRTVPSGSVRPGRHPATRTFQALRIAVNGELESLARFLDFFPEMLAPGGRAVFISFHSLEDRMVKTGIRKFSRRCVCPNDFPKCVCGKPGILRETIRKAVRPSPAEIESNPRSRSARMRVAEKI